MARFRKKKEQTENVLKASMALNTEELKIAEARIGDKPFFFGVGKATSTKKKVGGEVNLTHLAGEATYQAEREYNWEFFYNPNNMPGFISMEKAKELMSGTVSVVSGWVVPSSEPRPLTDELALSSDVKISSTKGVIISKKTISWKTSDV